MSSETIERGREGKAGQRGLCEELDQLLGVSKEPLASTSEGLLCAGSILCLQSHIRPHGNLRREVLALHLLDFAGEETEA